MHCNSFGNIPEIIPERAAQSVAGLHMFFRMVMGMVFGDLIIRFGGYGKQTLLLKISV